MLSILFLLNIALALTIDNGKYRINHLPSKISREESNSLIELNPTIEGDFHVMKMAATDYLCYIPPKEDEETTSFEIDEKQLKEQALRIINKAFTRSSCLFSYGINGGYWTFGYCYGDKVIQFHESLQYFIETNIHKPEFPNNVYILGRFPNGPKGSMKIENEAKKLDNDLKPSDVTLNEFSLINEGATAQVIQHTLDFGETCDLTKNPRTIEIIYRCDRNNYRVDIVDIQEIKTCRYQMIINIPHLCELKEFVPNKFYENVAEIGCKRIEDKPKDSLSSNLTETFFDDQIILPDRIFPVSKDSKININDYLKTPCGSGFFLARRSQPQTENTYWNERTVLIYNNEYESQRDLLLKVSGFFSSAMNFTLPSPEVIKPGSVRVLTWKDRFIAWYELYDFYGQFINMVRVEGDPKLDRILFLLLVDPETMKDHDNEPVEVNHLGVPNGVNFELFEGFETEIDDDEPIAIDQALTRDKEMDVIAQLAAELGIKDLDGLKQQLLYQFKEEKEKSEEMKEEESKEKSGKGEAKENYAKEDQNEAKEEILQEEVPNDISIEESVIYTEQDHEQVDEIDVTNHNNVINEKEVFLEAVLEDDEMVVEIIPDNGEETSDVDHDEL